MKFGKQFFLDAAELADAWRLIPRAIIIGYGALTWEVVEWFMALPVPSTEQSLLVSAVAGSFSVASGFYVNSGRSWKDKPNNLPKNKPE